jgi:hypothetical protein
MSFAEALKTACLLPAKALGTDIKKLSQQSNPAKNASYFADTFRRA